MTYGCNRNTKTLALAIKEIKSAKVISLYLQLKDDISERLLVKEKTWECNFCTNFRSEQISTFSFNNQATIIVPLLSTSIMFSRIETDPQVAPDKWFRFDLPVVIGCTASVSIQLSAFTKWLSTDIANWQIITSTVVQLRKALKQMSLVILQ